MKKSTSKLISSIVLIATLVVTGLGCKGLTPEEQSAIKPVTLNYWTVYNDLTELRKYAAEYKNIRPYVTINIRQIRYEEFDRLFTNALADDVAPDIISMHIRWLRKNQARLSPAPSSVNVARVFEKNKYTKEQAVVVDTIPMPKERDIKNNYVTTVYEDVVLDNGIYGLPLAFDSLALIYNQTILDRAGIANPPTTWTEFVENVHKITRFNATGDIVQSGVALGTAGNIDNFFDIVSLFLLQSEVKLSDGNSVTFATGVERSQDRSNIALRALDFYTDFARPTKEAYSWNDRMPNAFDTFVRGQSAFFLGFAYDYPRIKARAPQLDIRITTIPQLNPGNPINVANYWVESVPKKSEHQNEAWDFVRFITSKEKVKEYTTATLRPSPYREQISEQQKDEILEPFATQALFAENWYRGNDVTTAESAFKNLITEFLKPGDDSEKVLRRDKELIINSAARIQQTW